MIRAPPKSTLDRASAASNLYKRKGRDNAAFTTFSKTNNVGRIVPPLRRICDSSLLIPHPHQRLPIAHRLARSDDPGAQIDQGLVRPNAGDLDVSLQFVAGIDLSLIHI